MAGERAFHLRRVDWLAWLGAVRCRGRYWPDDDIVPLAVRMGNGALVRWTVAAARAAGVDCSVHEVSLSVAMRGSSCEALCALDVTGVAPFASWSLLLLAVINPCVGIQGVRHIAARGGPYGVDVLERAARGGRIGVLEYLPDDDGPATAAEAVVVAHNFGRRADAPDGGWRREAAARVLGWLRSQSFGCCGHGLVRRQQQRWQAFVALTGRPLPFPSCGASPNCRKIQPASGT